MARVTPTSVTSSDPPSVAVVEAVADAKSISASDLEPPLYEFVDPDALDRMLGTAETATVTFDAWEYEVTVVDEGDRCIVQIEGRGH